jgi:hypothetical protein
VSTVSIDLCAYRQRRLGVRATNLHKEFPADVSSSSTALLQQKYYGEYPDGKNTSTVYKFITEMSTFPPENFAFQKDDKRCCPVVHVTKAFTPGDFLFHIEGNFAPFAGIQKGEFDRYVVGLLVVEHTCSQLRPTGQMCVTNVAVYVRMFQLHFEVAAHSPPEVKETALVASRFSLSGNVKTTPDKTLANVHVVVNSSKTSPFELGHLSIHALKALKEGDRLLLLKYSGDAIQRKVVAAKKLANLSCWKPMMEEAKQQVRCADFVAVLPQET